MKGSGKQLFIRIIERLSTRPCLEDELAAATAYLRAAILLHGSTSEESIELALRLCWSNKPNDRHSPPSVQGVATTDGNFLTDIYDAIFSAPGLKEHVLSSCPTLTDEGYEAAEWYIWLLVAAGLMCRSVLSAEVNPGEDLAIDKRVEVYARKFDLWPTKPER